MTGYAHIRIDQERYVLITHVGCGRVKLTYDGGPEISMWDGTARYPWVYQFDGFEAFERSGYMFLAHAMLQEFDRQRRRPMLVNATDAPDVDIAAVEPERKNVNPNAEDSDTSALIKQFRWPTYCWNGGKICFEDFFSNKAVQAESIDPAERESTAGEPQTEVDDVNQ